MPRGPDPRVEQARKLYSEGLKLVEIASQLNIPEGTVRTWKNRYKWNKYGIETFQKKKTTKRNVPKVKDVSWVKIEHEYVTDLRKNPCTLEELAGKYDIPVKTVKDRSAKGGWVKKRTEYARQTFQKAKEKSSDADADRIVRLLSIADIASDKAEQALRELEQYVVKDKKKIKTVEYNDDNAVGKPTKEVLTETEKINVANGPVDRLGLSQVTGALKNLKEIYLIPETMEKQRAEIEMLKAKVQTDDGEENADDGFLEALNGSAAKDWCDEED